MLSIYTARYISYRSISRFNSGSFNGRLAVRVNIVYRIRKRPTALRDLDISSSKPLRLGRVPKLVISFLVSSTAEPIS